MHIHRIVLLAGLVALTPVLSACENFDMDKLDVFGLNEKKKLPGDRRPLFPEGVPGVQQGIPSEFIKGNQPAPDAAQTAPANQDNKTPAVRPAKKTAAVDPVDEAKPKPKRKPSTASKSPTRVTVQPTTQRQQPQQTQDQQPAPPQAQAPLPAQGQSTSGTPWPSSPAPGTFSR